MVKKGGNSLVGFGEKHPNIPFSIRRLSSSQTRFVLLVRQKRPKQKVRNVFLDVADWTGVEGEEPDRFPRSLLCTLFFREKALIKRELT